MEEEMWVGEYGFSLHVTYQCLTLLHGPLHIYIFCLVLNAFSSLWTEELWICALHKEAVLCDSCPFVKAHDSVLQRHTRTFDGSGVRVSHLVIWQLWQTATQGKESCSSSFISSALSRLLHWPVKQLPLCWVWHAVAHMLLETMSLGTYWYSWVSNHVNKCSGKIKSTSCCVVAHFMFYSVVFKQNAAVTHYDTIHRCGRELSALYCCCCRKNKRIKWNK